MRIPAPIFALFLVVTGLSSCAGHSLFRNGKSDYTIVVSSDAPESERYAAAELQSWIKEVSGVEIPVAGLADGVPDKRLVVGYNPIVLELVPESGKPDDRDDSFTLTTRGGDILLWGGSKRGTLYAVYSFLPARSAWLPRRIPGVSARSKGMRPPV